MKNYDNYKESEIQWIGEIPEHWEMSRLKFMGESIIGLTYSPEEVTEDESGYLVLRSSNIQNGKLSLNDNVFVKKQINEKLITRKDDILICARNGSVDLVGKNILIDEKTEGQTFGAFMTIFRGKSNQFVYWFFNSPFFDAQKGAFSTSTINQLTSTILNNLITTVPPEIEQTAIANYLDSKTTEIDRVVADKEALVNLYEEEKKALINEAVTKGIALSGKLKPSGVDWLGDVPEHWEVKKLFYLFDKISSGTTPKSDEESYYLDGHINWLNTGDLNNSRITETSKKITQKAFDDHSALKVYPIGSIVIAMYGATIGKLGILDIETTTNQACCVLSDIKNTNTLYVFNCLISGQEALINLSYGGGQPNISQDTLRNFRIPIPPLEEQTAIVQYIESETANINDKINQIKQEIALLKEYRQALIFEAVTGKIRVD